MSSENTNTFNKENLNTYLGELAKQYRKLCGKTVKAEIILVGGAAVLANYDFRDMTTDVDALIQATSSMKDAINMVGDKYNLPNGWLNADFRHTASFSMKLVQYSQYYRTFSNVLQVRTVNAEYLVAMKLMSGRQYKHDLSDVVGILVEHLEKGEPLTMATIERAVVELYGAWEKLPATSQSFIRSAMEHPNLRDVYAQINRSEQEAKSILVSFEERYPGVTTQENVNDILAKARAKAASKESLLDELKAKRKSDRDAR